MNRFTRGGDIMEKVGVGVKKDMPKISRIYVRLGEVVEKHPSGLVYKSRYIRELHITNDKEGLRTIKKLNKLLERTKQEYILKKWVLRGVSRLSIQNIFDFSAGELQHAGVLDIRYKIEKEDQKGRPITESVIGCEAVWKPTGDIIELKIGVIYLLENDFWFKILGMDYD